MKLYRIRFSTRALLFAVGLCALVFWAIRVSRSSRPENLYAGWLGHEEMADRIHAAEELGSLGAEGVAAIPALTQALSADPSPEVRKASAAALARIAGEIPGSLQGQSVIAALAMALDDSEATVRTAAAHALAQISPEPDLVFPPLLRAATDLDIWVRGAAITALGRIQNNAKMDDPRVRRILVDAINEDDFHVREMGIYAFLDTAGKSPDLANAMLKEPDVRARRAATVALARSSIASSHAILGLIGALSDTDRTVRLKAANALGNLGQPSPGILRGLSNALKDGDHEVSEAAAKAITAINELRLPPEPERPRDGA